MEANFKDAKYSSGIYRIYNGKKDRSYYGSTCSFRDRHKAHKELLLSKQHFNKFLQRDFDKCGIDDFIFEVIEITTLEERKIIEQIYLDVYWDKQNKCYNVRKKVAPDRKNYSNNTSETSKILSIMTGISWTNPVVREKRLQGMKEARNNLTTEEKESYSNSLKQSWDDERKIAQAERISLRHLEPKFKISLHSPESKETRKETFKFKNIKKHKELCDKKILDTNWHFDRKDTLKNPCRKIINANLLSPDGILYKNIENISDFCSKFKLDERQTKNLIKLKLITFKGWIKYFDLESNYRLYYSQKLTKKKKPILDNEILTLKEIEKLNEIIGYSILEKKINFNCLTKWNNIS